MTYQELSVHLSTQDNGGLNTMEAHRASYNSGRNATSTQHPYRETLVAIVNESEIIGCRHENASSFFVR